MLADPTLLMNNKNCGIIFIPNGLIARCREQLYAKPYLGRVPWNHSHPLLIRPLILLPHTSHTCFSAMLVTFNACFSVKISNFHFFQCMMQTGRSLFQYLFKFRHRYRPYQQQQQQQCCSTLRKMKPDWSRTGTVLAPVCILSFGFLATFQEAWKDKPDNKVPKNLTTDKNGNQSHVQSKQNSLKTIQSFSRFSSFASIKVT